MKKPILFLFLVISTIAFPQDIDFEWVKGMGSTGNDGASSITTDDQGNVYTIGYFRNSIDFDPGTSISILSANSPIGAFIQKLDPNGNFLWAKSLNGIDAKRISHVKCDVNGNVYVIGYFEGTVDFDPGPFTQYRTSNGAYDLFILKLDTQGNFIWANSYGSSNSDYGYSIIIDNIGDLYLTGSFADTVDFDASSGVFNLISNGFRDIFILKLGSNGNLIWAKSIGGNSYDTGYSITQNDLGELLLLGLFRDTVDFDPGPAVNILTPANVGDNETFIAKFDTNGNLIWAKSIGVSAFFSSSSITTDSYGDVYCAGNFEGTVDFDPGSSVYNLSSNGGSDIFLLKLDLNGNFVWAHSYGDTGNDRCRSITTDVNGDVLFCGFYVGTVDFDPSPTVLNFTSNGSWDIVFQKLDRDANVKWTKSIGNFNGELGYAIHVDTTENIYLAGEFAGTTDFNPGGVAQNLTANGLGNVDIFVLKLSQCYPDYTTDTISACVSYTWIDGITYTANDTSATYLTTNIQGCDSIVSLHLTITPVDTSTIVVDNYLLAVTSNASYQWLDCNNGYAIIEGETNQGFTADDNGSYAVEVTENGCTDTSNCIVVSGLSINDLAVDQIRIFPNPTNGHINLELGNLENTSIRVFNASEQLLFQTENIKTPVYQFELNQPSGIYVIEIKSEGISKRFKLIKE